MEHKFGQAMTTRVRKSAHERKKEIADAAIRLAADIGPDRLTTEKLANEIGISQPAIFRHFPTKNDIWLAVANRIVELMNTSSKSYGKENLTPIERLQKLITGQLEFIKSTPAIPAILFSRELHAENEELRAFFAGMMSRRQKLLSELLQSEIDAGILKPGLNADDAAWFVLALVQGLAMRWSLNNRDFDLVEEGSRLLDLQLDGFRKTTPSY